MLHGDNQVLVPVIGCSSPRLLEDIPQFLCLSWFCLRNGMFDVLLHGYYVIKVQRLGCLIFLVLNQDFAHSFALSCQTPDKERFCLKDVKNKLQEGYHFVLAALGERMYFYLLVEYVQALNRPKNAHTMIPEPPRFTVYCGLEVV
ncbi:hypothetical protein XENOCAPTIV_008440 [Xenoophorus captivus]|uniref:Uncharacterized protein n=1 Tax=Xenoophorus captivus TaxID=1517983 RepID=A0ABV0S1P0_9TELE